MGNSMRTNWEEFEMAQKVTMNSIRQFFTANTSLASHFLVHTVMTENRRMDYRNFNVRTTQGLLSVLIERFIGRHDPFNHPQATCTECDRLFYEVVRIAKWHVPETYTRALNEWYIDDIPELKALLTEVDEYPDGFKGFHFDDRDKEMLYKENEDVESIVV